MTIKRGVWLLLVFFVLAGFAYYWTDLQKVEGGQTASPLAKTINACDLIAEKAAMHLPVSVPFQRLEKAARRMRVFENCMHDRGFKQNKVWHAYAEPLAKQQAKQGNVSNNEAYEHMRRASMLLFKKAKDVPLYWVQSNAAFAVNDD